MESCDFIVIGSGIAGLRAAIDLARIGSVRVFCKGDPQDSNTRWAQGGIAAAMQEGDTVEFHLQDTLSAGDGLCWEPAVRTLVEEGPRRIQELVGWGAEFDQRSGKYVFGREGAHSHSRILHSGDATGLEIVRALLSWVKKTSGIELVPFRPAVTLLTEGGRFAGIESMDERTGERVITAARAALLATGGGGQIYSHTTNPLVATGDGVALAHRAGADLMDLEFFQFHPTAFHLAGAPRFLLTEALRGEGALLRNAEGNAFMAGTHRMADLAPRDIVSRAIISEMKNSGSSWVYLDATGIGRGKLRERFPNIYQFLQTYELDLSVDLIPVSPSAHYWMGGVKTDLDGRTSIDGLYAAGEAACAGVHGANRLASNSLLEGLVFGARAAEAMAGAAPRPRPSSAMPEDPGSELRADADELRRQLQTQNWQRFGIIRSESGIRQGLDFLASIPRFRPRNLQELELLNLLDCSTLMGSFALQRRESRGSQYREDFPEKDPRWAGYHSVLHNGSLEMAPL
jgi:L-aspartate oxidase